MDILRFRLLWALNDAGASTRWPLHTFFFDFPVYILCFVEVYKEGTPDYLWLKFLSCVLLC